MFQIYNLSEAARLVQIPNAGRNKIYKLLREDGKVNENNKPAQRYIDLGVFATGSYVTAGRYVTLIVGWVGLIFLKQTIKNYLQTHPMPTFPRNKNVYVNE
jgi:hypothetical protein